MTYFPHEIVTAGQKLYDEKLKVQLEPLYHGKLLALDVGTGEYAIGDDTLSAFERLKEKDPAATVYILRVGYPTAITLGTLRSFGNVTLITDRSSHPDDRLCEITFSHAE